MMTTDQQISRHQASRFLGSVREPLPAAAGDTPVEALEAAAAVDQLLATGVERMAVGADLDAQVAAGGSGRELVAARALHADLGVVGVEIGLHGTISLDDSYSRDDTSLGPEIQLSLASRIQNESRDACWLVGLVGRGFHVAGRVVGEPTT
jgi:hypothetical protein